MPTLTKQRRPKANGTDPFETDSIASVPDEKAFLAYVINLIDRDPEQARAITATVPHEAFTATDHPIVFDAILTALKADRPAIGDVALAIRRAQQADGADYTTAMHLVRHMVEEATVTVPQAIRLATEAAKVVHESHVRRTAMRALADSVAQVRDGMVPVAIGGAIEQLHRVQAAMEHRRAESRRLRVRLASDIQPEPIEWFWPQRFSRGSLTIITGLPGLSKSLLTIDITARITTGGKWPDGTGSAPQGGVLMFGTEDDPERIVVPRLMAAGADLSLVRIVEGAEDRRHEWLAPISIDRDLQLVREQLDSFPECKAIIFDPLTQFIEAEENSNAQTRAALAPLVTLAQERGITVLAVMHLNKKSDAMAVQRIAGASSYGQIARHILFVGNDPDDAATGVDKRRAMIVAKNSYGPMNVGQLYRVIARHGDVPGIEWCAGTVEMDAEKLNPKPSGVSREHEEQRSEAVDALRDILAGGPVGAADVQTAMEAQGYSRRMVGHASKVLNITKQPTLDDRGRRKGWVWALPGKGSPDATSGDESQPGTYSIDEWGRD
jgi:putative DNA primase/helicase